MIGPDTVTVYYYSDVIVILDYSYYHSVIANVGWNHRLGKLRLY